MLCFSSNERDRKTKSLLFALKKRNVVILFPEIEMISNFKFFGSLVFYFLFESFLGLNLSICFANTD